MAIIPTPTEGERSYSNFRALSLYCLVSNNLASDSTRRDFYTGILPFFEPFVQEHAGEILDVPRLLKYSRSKLMLPMTEDVARLFVERMHAAGWLTIVASSGGGTIYRCAFKQPAHLVETKDINSDLDRLLQALRHFLGKHGIAAEALSNIELEDQFLAFLARNLSSGSGLEMGAAADSVASDRTEYWIAKFISNLCLEHPDTFRTVERIAGISLMAEALIEIRSPTPSMKRKKNVRAYIDGPLLMDYMGLSGNVQRDNAAFVIDKLKALGIEVACFRHTCDEIRDNLWGVLGRAESQRTGPTANALRKREVRREYAQAVRDNVELFVEKTARISVDYDKPENFESIAEYCDDVVIDELRRSTPASTDTARERDAWSIGVIMRRREGHEDGDVFHSRYLLITSNPELVSVSNAVLRKHRILSKNKSTVGPAVHHRVVSGLLFANGGVDEKSELSRRQLLASCDQVVRIRPRVLDGFVQQVGLWRKQENPLVLEALLSQPRATEIIMDHSIGKGRAVSSSNVDEILEELRKASADDVRNDLEVRFAAERDHLLAEHKQNDSELRGKLDELQSEKSSQVAQLQASIDDIRSQMGLMQQAQLRARETADVERQKFVLERQKLVTAALTLCGNSLRATKTIELYSMITTGAVLLMLALWTSFAGFLGWNDIVSFLISVGFAGVGAIGLVLSGWNKPITFIERWFQRWAESQARRALRRAGLSDMVRRVRITYGEGRVQMLTDEQLAATERRQLSDLRSEPIPDQVDVAERTAA
jgi:hypothetical protein